MPFPRLSVRISPPLLERLESFADQHNLTVFEGVIAAHRVANLCETASYGGDAEGMAIAKRTVYELKTQLQTGYNLSAWFLDADFKGLCFHVNQAFFPRTSTWNSLKKGLKETYDDEVWEHLAGTISVPFEAGEH